MDQTKTNDEQAAVEALAEGLREHSAATYLGMICSAGSMTGIPHASFKRYVDSVIREIVGVSKVPPQFRMLAEQLVLNHQSAMQLQARGVQATNPQHCKTYIGLATELSAENRRLLKMIQALLSAQINTVSTGRASTKRASKNKLGSKAA